MNGEQIQRAIEATEPSPEPLAMCEVPIMIGSTGRPAIMGVPEDITQDEVDELAAWMLMNLRKHIAKSRQPASRIEVVRGTLPSR